ncbi:MAG: hypothetical protein ACK6EB_04485, partial [Planctomyces sp.]
GCFFEFFGGVNFVVGYFADRSGMGEEAAEQEAFETIAAVVPAIQAVFRTAAAGLAAEPAGLCSGSAVAGAIDQLHRGD